MAFIPQLTGLVNGLGRNRLSASKCAQRPVLQRPKMSATAVPQHDPSIGGSEQSPKEAPADSEREWKAGKLRAPRKMRGGGRVRRGRVTPQGKKYGFQKLPPNPPGMRITAGSARGRRLKSPGVYLRPMMSRVREALFSMLSALGALTSDGTVLDLFAGSGSVGIEAISRGMARGVFVDFSLECVRTISSNLEHCAMDTRGEAVCSTVEAFLEEGAMYNGGRHYDLITITPPYEEVDYGELMKAVAESDCVGEGTFVVVEYPVELKIIPPSVGYRLVGIRNRRYGRTVVAVYACQPDIDIDRRPEEFINVKQR